MIYLYVDVKDLKQSFVFVFIKIKKVFSFDL